MHRAKINFCFVQTNGQILNLYKGMFSQNGSSGYVLKPPFLREKYSASNARRKDEMPGLYHACNFMVLEGNFT